MNKVILTGNLGNDPELYLTQDGREIVTFSLATNHSWKDETGEWQSATDWHQVSVFRESTIRWIKDVLKRGHKVYVEGKLTYQHWTDKFGQKRITPYVVITDREGCIEEVRSAARSVSLPSNLNLANSISESNSEQEVISSGSDHENEDVLFVFPQEQTHPKN
ncbi:MAG: single-stranded DNA-binding protein [Alphaproteobacteria bacterium]|nr:single-stranded DNA-binding protein [Alphaproteobacteria bacterium]